MELINVPQLITQILGFLVMLWLLGRFAWKPLLQSLDDRRQKIAGDIGAAEKARADMESLKADFETRIREIESTARGRIAEAAREGEKLASQIVEEGRARAREQFEKATADFAREREKALVEMRAQIVQTVALATEKVIHERLDDAGHRKLIERFVDEVEAVQ